jgi:hypothetical protein
MEATCIFFEVGTDFLNIIQMSFGLQRVKKYFPTFYILAERM